MTKDELERENAELRGQNEQLRWQLRAMIRAQQHYCDAVMHLNEAGRIKNDLMEPLWTPTTLHD